MYSVILMVITNLYQACNLQCIPKWGVARVQHRFLTFKSTLDWLFYLFHVCQKVSEFNPAPCLSIILEPDTRVERGVQNTASVTVWSEPTPGPENGGHVRIVRTPSEAYEELRVH